ncbi:cytidylyltransferase domain-containing protein [Mycolicibacterium pulveris]|uniref:acylneuraminate cytidylyltransferase family protein n=1 Tax=Mycolicibacterium pulveris TaxID=36813 RepID=UPI003CEC40AE
MTSRVTAIVPMRHSSERVKGKNYRRLGGKPLFRHIVDTLLKSQSVARVVIDTDSPVIMEYVAANLPDVLVLERPEHLRDGAIAMNDVLANTLSQVGEDVFLQTHSTNPFLRAETIDRAVKCFFDEGVDSLFTTTPMQARFWWDADRPVNHDPAVLLRTQDLAPLHLENSCLYIFRRGPFLSEKNRITAKRAIYPVSALEAVDIDTEEDWHLAAALMERRS